MSESRSSSLNKLSYTQKTFAIPGRVVPSKSELHA